MTRLFLRQRAVLIAGFATAFTVFLISSLAPYFLAQITAIFVLTFICVFIGRAYPAYFFLAFITNFFIVLAAGLPITQVENVERLYLIVIAVFFVMGLDVIFSFLFFRNKWRFAMVLFLRDLKSLNTEIFSCLLEPEYVENTYLYEKRLHLCKKQVMRSIIQLQMVHTQSEKTADVHRIALLERTNLIFDNILDYAQIRRRTSDFTTFALCRSELNAIAQGIGQTIDQMILRAKRKSSSFDIYLLEHPINRLDDNYQHVLQVAAREPLVFVLFIDSLSAFSKQLEEMYQLM